MRAVADPWARDAEAILEELTPSGSDGLRGTEVRDRRARYGSNQLQRAAKLATWLIFVTQFKSLIVALLAAAACLSFAFQDFVEAGAIVVVILINALIGFFTELRAVRSMEALRLLTNVNVTVRRDGKAQRLPAVELVPGDIVLLEGGDVVAADLRLVTCSRLQADESSLTGESVPVSKRCETLPEDTQLSDRVNMLFKGTSVTRGGGEGVVTATGMVSELGQISALVEEAEDEITPLEKRLDRLGRRLIWVTLVVAAATGATGILAGKEVYLMIETSIALAVAAIPEGLPIVATIALARGMWRMARRNALVNRLSAVETLGATNVICTDKTGTLTENRMTAVKLVLPGEEIELPPGTKSFLLDHKEIEPGEDPALTAALESCVLCNNASLRDDEDDAPADGPPRGVGDPLELALLAAGSRAGISTDGLKETLPRVREEAFDPDVKMMATFHRRARMEGCVVAVKGAAEAVLGASSDILEGGTTRELTAETRDNWLKMNEGMARDGLRVLALARKSADTGAEDDPAYENLTFIGLIGLLDPARPDVRDAIRETRASGIRVVMVTGDQPQTAVHVARDIGLIEDDASEIVLSGRDILPPDALSGAEAERIRGAQILARVTPKQKLDLIEIHQRAGDVVAMTGDGVNDAPALKEADIGIAMGLRGTEVAREASDMVLKDDSFSTIVAAVREGRVIFDNIRKFVFYLMSCNLSEILVVGLASAVNAPLPILPLQILFLNLVTDVFPALALGMGEGSANVMARPPRRSTEGILGRRDWIVLGLYGLLIAGSVLAALALALHWLKLPSEQAVSISFLVLAIAQLWHVFNMRENTESPFVNDITRNRFVWGALALCAVLILAAVYLPGLAGVLKVHSPPAKGWLLVLGMSFVPLIVGQIVKSGMGARGNQP